MLGAVHASVGAGVGSFFKNKAGAFLTGVFSHLIADALPHKDFTPKVEVALMTATVAGIAAWKGTDSPEFWGAIGGIAPDTEHGLMIAGLIKPEDEIFPTHVAGGVWHGRETNERWSQLALAGASLIIAALNASRDNTKG